MGPSAMEKERNETKWKPKDRSGTDPKRETEKGGAGGKKLLTLNVPKWLCQMTGLKNLI